MKTDFKVYPRKIDISVRAYRRNAKKSFWVYEASTKAYKTCKEAKHAFCLRHGLDASQVKCSFAEAL